MSHTRLKYIIVAISVSMSSLGSIASAAADASHPASIKAAVTPFPIVPMPAQVSDLASENGQLFVVDATSHRILVLQDGEIIRSIGGIGNGPGELFYPRDLAVSGARFIVVNDTGNRRFQILGLRGGYRATLERYGAWGLAAAEDRIFIGYPASDSLVEVFLADGTSAGSIGSPISVGTLGTPKSSEAEKQALFRALNRVQIATGSDGSVWLAFLHRPLIRKYSSSGDLVAETTIEVAVVKRLQRSLHDPNLRPPTASSINIDGVQLTVLFREIAFDPRSKSILLLTGDGHLISLSAETAELRHVIVLEGIRGGAVALAPATSDAGLAILSSDSSLVSVQIKNPSLGAESYSE